MAGPRRRAREIALQVLVSMDVNPDLDAAHALRLYFDHLAADAEIDPDEVKDSGSARPSAFDRVLVDALVLGVATHRKELDEIVQERSHSWRLERMALVERNVIRLALYETKWTPEVPTNVVLNEAIDLARRFGTSEGAAFVNGLLDRIVTELQLRR